MYNRKENRQARMNFDSVKFRVFSEYSSDVTKKLSDDHLMNEYLKCDSTNNKIQELRDVLEKNDITQEKISSILMEYIPKIVPPGTKGKIRGDKFNSIVKNVITDMHLPSDVYDIQFEKMSDHVKTDETPDWFVTNKNTGKTIIGMNQVDLWSGGHQRNRGTKYIFDEKINGPNSKLLCVVANRPTFTTAHSLQFKLIKTGFERDTLCYVRNLPAIIRAFVC